MVFSRFRVCFSCWSLRTFSHQCTPWWTNCPLNFPYSVGSTLPDCTVLRPFTSPTYCPSWVVGDRLLCYNTIFIIKKYRTLNIKYDIKNNYFIISLLSLFPPPQIPTLIVEPTVYTTIIYCMAGLQNDLYAYFLTIIITILVMAVSTSCGPYNNIMYTYKKYKLL